MFAPLKTQISNRTFIVASLLGLLSFIFLVCLGIYFFLFADQSNNGVYSIELREDGFHPKTLSITEGDTVVFSTTNDMPFWPASNVHPTHTAFPAFDPREPLDSNTTWQFTFEKAGTYGFHDHIASRFEGEITVKKSDGTKVTVNCKTEKTVQCWERLMIDTLNKKGVEAALNEILILSQTEPSFANDCHGYTHLIGEKAYDLYVSQKNFELTPATALCGYGFYHGFMGTLLETTGNIDEARSFCDDVAIKLAGKASDAGTACYHGTGHGAIDGSDPTAWGNIDAMMEPGFKLCSLLAVNELQLYLCNTGVFNAIEILSADPKYGITDLRDDPFVMCNQQPIERREACYSNMLPIILNMTYSDFVKSAQYINENMIDHKVIAIDGHTVNELVTIGLMFEFIRVYGETDGYQEKGIAFCRAQPEDDHLACIEGLSGGHIKYGEPGVEYVQNLAFCKNPLLASDEIDACYKYTLQRVAGRYDIQTSKKICNMVDAQYRERYCQFY